MPMQNEVLRGQARHRNARIVTLSVLLTTLLIALGMASAQGAYGEAPMLAEQVAAGELPAVEERLPPEPVVVPVVESIGEYGGTWNLVTTGRGEGGVIASTIGYENLVRWDPEWSEILPNLAESYEISEDGTDFIFRLREGIRWSDGEPFTSADILFWYEDILLNEELTPVIHERLQAGGEVVQVSAPDDYTVIFDFAAPKAEFLERLAAPGALMRDMVSHPRHHFERFHIDYNSDANELAREQGFEDWVGLFQSRATLFDYSDTPVLFAWKLNIGFAEGTTRLEAERNPYYWKVDPEGNQLPYIDRVVFDIVQDPDVITLRALNGEIDFIADHVNTLENKALFIDSMDRGDYRLIDVNTEYMNTVLIALNQAHRDPVKREIFSNRDFRIGLSHAIDRQEIIDLVFVGQGEPWQAAPRPESPFFDEEFAKQYTEYDVELANEYLDRAGYSERDSQGFRVGPDGERITIFVEAVSNFQNGIDVLELVVEDWEEVGIDAEIRTVERSLFFTRTQAIEHDATIWEDGPGGMDIFFSGWWYGPFNEYGSHYGIPWVKWFLDPSNPLAVEPPDQVKEQRALFEELGTTMDPERQEQLIAEILEIGKEQFYAMGISLPAPRYGIVSNDLRNVPDSVLDSIAAFPMPAPQNPSQFFFEGGARRP